VSQRFGAVRQLDSRVRAGWGCAMSFACFLQGHTREYGRASRLLVAVGSLAQRGVRVTVSSVGFLSEPFSSSFFNCFRFVCPSEKLSLSWSASPRDCVSRVC